MTYKQLLADALKAAKKHCVGSDNPLRACDVAYNVASDLVPNDAVQVFAILVSEPRVAELEIPCAGQMRPLDVAVEAIFYVLQDDILADICPNALKCGWRLQAGRVEAAER